jgi:hypothetical protein
MAAFASSIYKTSGLEIGYQFSDLWGHAYASFTKFVQRWRSPAGASNASPGPMQRLDAHPGPALPPAR